MEKEDLKNKINKYIKECISPLGNKKKLPELNKLLLDWAKLNNKSFVDGCMDFNLYMNPKLGDIQKLPF